MALAQDTPILLLDEPTTYLDLAHQLEVLDLLADLNEQGRTIGIVLHDLNHACRYAHHLVALRDGRVHAAGRARGDRRRGAGAGRLRPARPRAARPRHRHADVRADRTRRHKEQRRFVVEGDGGLRGLLRAHVTAVTAYVARRVRRPDLTFDLVAETFARALEHRDRYDPRKGPEIAWLFGIAHNLIVDAARRGRVADAARVRLGMEPIALDDEQLERIVERGRTDLREALAAAHGVPTRGRSCGACSASRATRRSRPPSAARNRSSASASRAGWRRCGADWRRDERPVRDPARPARARRPRPRNRALGGAARSRTALAAIAVAPARRVGARRGGRRAQHARRRRRGDDPGARAAADRRPRPPRRASRPSRAPRPRRRISSCAPT